MNTKALEFATMLDEASKFPAYPKLPYAEIANELIRRGMHSTLEERNELLNDLIKELKKESNA